MFVINLKLMYFGKTVAFSPLYFTMCLFRWPKKTGNEGESSMAVEALFFERIYMNISWHQSYDKDAIYIVTRTLNDAYFFLSD